MKSKRRLGIDLDDVLTDFQTALMEYHNKVYGTALRREDFKTYQFNQVWGGSLQEAIQKVNDFHQSIYSKQISPIPDSANSVEILSKENELFVITSRHKLMKEETEKWLNKFFRGSFSDVFYSSNYYSGAEGKSKSEICKELEVSALIDDSFDYIKQCSSFRIKGILFGDYPWNQNGNLPSNVVRVRNWKEVLEQLT